MSEKIQKVLARIGLASRREIERWIADGRIEVNGRLATIGDRITERDKVLVDGARVKINVQQKTRIIMYNKPDGEICTRSDPEDRPTVYDALPDLDIGRWISIGRLDFNTSGLMLFTNDGELANLLMHPAQQIQREYAVRILGEVTHDMVVRLTEGVHLNDGKARFEDIVDSGGRGANHWFHVVVCEGRNRLVRRLWESQGVTVSRLQRVRFGPIFLDKKLRQGQCADLSASEINRLREQAGQASD